MKVFISWSGPRSRYIADALRGWLPRVIQSLRPWMSDEDIAAGSRWIPEIAKELSDSRVGLLCITPENQSSPWLLFEAGALSKTLDQTFVCPMLFDMSPAQLAGPLTQFQSLTFQRDGVLKLLATLNRALGDSQLPTKDLEEIFDVWWPKLASRLEAAPPTQGEKIEKRDVEDFLEEILTNTREQLRRENLRLEHQRTRDAKLDDVLGHMAQFASIAEQIRERGRKVENLMESMPIPPEIKQLLMGSKMPIPQMQDMLKTMKELSDQSRAATEEILTPPTPGQPDSEQT